MPVIRSNGRERYTELTQLVIPHKCVIDFCNGTVLREGCSTPENIDSALLLLLDIFYSNPNQYLSQDVLLQHLYGTDYENIGSNGNVKSDVSRLRKVIGDTSGEIITTKRNFGYRFVWKEEGVHPAITLEVLFRHITAAGKLPEICVSVKGEELKIEKSAMASARSIAEFFFPPDLFLTGADAVTVENMVHGHSVTKKEVLQEFYHSAAATFDEVWKCSCEAVTRHLLVAQELKMYYALNSVRPGRTSDLDSIGIDKNNMLDALRKQLSAEIERLLDAPQIKRDFFMNTRVVVAEENVIDGIAALALTSMCYITDTRRYSRDERQTRYLMQYKELLVKKIREIFFSFSGSGSELEDEALVIERLRFEFNWIMDKATAVQNNSLMDEILKIFTDRPELSVVLKNRGITAADESNSREPTSPTKQR